MGITKYVETSHLPHDGKKINWLKSVGYRCSFIYGDITGEVKITDYVFDGKVAMLTIQYNDKENKIKTDSFKYGELGRAIGRISRDYKYDIGQTLQRKTEIKIINRERRDKSTKDKKRQWKWYEIQCSECGKKHWLVESQLANGSGCPYCIPSAKLCEGVNDIPTTAPWMIPYFQGGLEEAKQYTHSSSEKINPICPICGTIQKNKKKIGDIYKYHSIGCQCDGNMSYPELIMYNILKQFEIPFITQASKSVLPWANNYRYDFYLLNIPCIIETHGGQHYEENNLTIRSLEEEQNNDKIKKDLAVNNGIEFYFQVDCRESNADWIINSCINCGLFSLLNIDESKINFDNLYLSQFNDEIKKCKEIVNKNPNITFAELTRQLGFKHYYDTQRVLDINRLKVRSNRMPVAIFDNDKIIKEFPSMAEASRFSQGKEYQASIATIHKYIDKNTILCGRYRYEFINTF